MSLYTDRPLLTVQSLLEELKEVDDWYLFGAYLGVPVYKLNEIQSTSEHRGVERCKLDMLQYWFNTTMTTSWKDIARALEQMDKLTLAAKLKLKCQLTMTSGMHNNNYNYYYIIVAFYSRASHRIN